MSLSRLWHQNLLPSRTPSTTPPPTQTPIETQPDFDCSYPLPSCDNLKLVRTSYSCAHVSSSTKAWATNTGFSQHRQQTRTYRRLVPACFVDRPTHPAIVLICPRSRSPNHSRIVGKSQSVVVFFLSKQNPSSSPLVWARGGGVPLVPVACDGLFQVQSGEALCSRHYLIASVCTL